MSKRNSAWTQGHISSPHQFFDEGTAYPAQLADLMEELKKLDSETLGHVSVLVKAIQRE